MKKEEAGNELMELGHDAVPGYRPIFYIVMAIASLYLGFILMNTI